jgi:large subunit ribosomal protein L23
MGILIKPIVTEKAAEQNETGTFVFAVDKEANKISIKNEVESTYGVTVQSVNTMVYPGKPKTRYTKSRVISGRTPSYKKAIVKLKEGDFIDFYSNI